MSGISCEYSQRIPTSANSGGRTKAWTNGVRIPLARGPGQGPIARRDVLGGIIHDYERWEIA
jgi:hypothetical protein